MALPQESLVASACLEALALFFVSAGTRTGGALTWGRRGPGARRTAVIRRQQSNNTTGGRAKPLAAVRCRAIPGPSCCCSQG